MLVIKQGDTYRLPVYITIDEEHLTDENARKVEFAFETRDQTILKYYPNEVVFEDGCFVVPLTQEDTFALRKGVFRYKIRTLLMNGEEVRSTDIMSGSVEESISREVLK